MKATFAGIALAISILASSQLSAAAGDGKSVGVTDFTFDAEHRVLPVHALIFYPAAGGGRSELIGDDAVFNGEPVRRNAEPLPGQHPLILLSHGSGGKAAFLAWIATRLAEDGFVVIAPDHPGSTSGDSRPETTITFWERVRDMSALLDAVGNSVSLRRIVDTSSVTVMGFSLGGHTALALAGARTSAAVYARYCDDHPAAMDCIWYDRGNEVISGHVDLHVTDETRFAADYSDLRVTRIVAIDPAMAPAISTESMKHIEIPVLILNLGNAGMISPGVDGRSVAAAIAHSAYQTVPGADHFSFLATCKRLSWLWLMLDGDDAVCSATGGQSRGAVHEEIVSKIRAFLKKQKT